MIRDKIINYDNRIKDIEAKLALIDIDSVTALRIDQCSVISNVELFINAQYSSIKANNMQTFENDLLRLEKFLSENLC